MVENAFLWMLNGTLRGSLLLLYIMAFRLLVRKSSRKWCYILWGLGWFRLLCPWTPSFLRYRSALLPRVDWFQKELLTGETADVVVEATSRGDALTVYRLPVTGEQMTGILSIAAWVWIAGMAVLLAAMAVSSLRLHRWVKQAELVREGAYPVYRCVRLTVPFSMGVFKKRVYLPLGLSPEEEEMVIAHEQTHLSRNDPFWKLAVSLIRVIHWMNPLVWLAFRLWGADMEYTCDERVFQWMDAEKKPDYCRALATISQKPYASCPVAFAEGGVKGRIKNLLKPRKHKILWGLLAGYLILDLFALGMTEELGTEIGAKVIDPALFSRLETVLQWMRENPERMGEIGWFDDVSVSEEARYPNLNLTALLYGLDLTAEGRSEEEISALLAPYKTESPVLRARKHELTEDGFGNWIDFGNMSVEINLTAELPPLFSSSWNSGAYYRFESYEKTAYGCPYEWSYGYANEIYYLYVTLFCRDVWPNQAERMLTEMIEAAESIMNEFS
jgi:beta-lactamase regulating signal transducer with metallopeptidase domain